MKFNGNLLNPSLSISKEEREKLNELRNELFTELNEYREIINIELHEVIENFYTSAIQIELLERIALETKLNLAFNDYYYKAQCFKLDLNGNVQITSQDSTFIAYVHGFKMLENPNSIGFAIAKNITKVLMIEHICSIIHKGNYHLLKKYDKEHLNIFRAWGFEFFQYLSKRFDHIKSEETRYTLIHTFLKKYDLIHGKDKEYREMVRLTTNIGIAFKNFSKKGKDEKDSFFEGYEPELIELLRNFKEENNI